jgi:16S rRNA (guanine527-N7)-methyltransferase
VERRAQLLEILRRAQLEGFLGPADISAHLEHALGFADAAESQLPEPPARFADLGTGGGVPGLALALRWPDSRGALIESAARRSQALREWVAELELEDRVEVLEGRAEAWARAAGIREAFDLVTARSFARPAVTAEIGAGLVRVGGYLVVSEPPESAQDRWPAASVEELGLSPAVAVVARGAHYVCLHKALPAGPSVPRAVGKPGKRPLW